MRMQKAINLLGGLFLLTALTVQAGTQPKFAIVALVKPASVITTADIVNAVYRVTNNTLIARTLTMVSIQGVKQTTVAPGACKAQFPLNSGQSCNLYLEINGSQIGSGYAIAQGPVICKTSIIDNTTPDSFLCSQPSFQDILRVRVA